MRQDAAKSSSCGPTAKSRLRKADPRLEEQESTITVNTSFPCSFLKNEPTPQPAPIKPSLETMKQQDPPRLSEPKLYTPARKAGVQSGQSLRQFITQGQRKAPKVPSTELETTISNLQSLIDSLSQEAEST